MIQEIKNKIYRLINGRLLMIPFFIFNAFKKLIKIKKEKRSILNFSLLRIKQKLRLKLNVLRPSLRTIDLVIPTITKDFEVLNAMLDSLKFVENKIGRVIIVGNENEAVLDFCQKRNIEFIDENSLLGFGKEKIDYVVNGKDRSGWLFQQLLKLSSDKLVSSDYFLILDSDTVFIEPIFFLDSGDNTIFFQSDEYHLPYFKAMSILLPELKPHGVSFVSHGMLFKKDILSKLKNEIESNTKKLWYESIIDLASDKEASCFSEYELYGNYFISNSKKYKLYPFLNISLKREELINISKYKMLNKYSSLSFHSYMS